MLSRVFILLVWIEIEAFIFFLLNYCNTFFSAPLPSPALPPNPYGSEWSFNSKLMLSFLFQIPKGFARSSLAWHVLPCHHHKVPPGLNTILSGMMKNHMMKNEYSAFLPLKTCTLHTTLKSLSSFQCLHGAQICWWFSGIPVVGEDSQIWEVFSIE